MPSSAANVESMAAPPTPVSTRKVKGPRPPMCTSMSRWCFEVRKGTSTAVPRSNGGVPGEGSCTGAHAIRPASKPSQHRCLAPRSMPSIMPRGMPAGDVS